MKLPWKLRFLIWFQTKLSKWLWKIAYLNYKLKSKWLSKVLGPLFDFQLGLFWYTEEKVFDLNEHDES